MYSMLDSLPPQEREAYLAKARGEINETFVKEKEAYEKEIEKRVEELGPVEKLLACSTIHFRATSKLMRIES